MEFVAERGGVTYIDDSKGTNVAAVVEALAAVRAPIILIAGGMDKGGDYAPLRALLGEKVRLLILIGAARDTMRPTAAMIPVTCGPSRHLCPRVTARISTTPRSTRTARSRARPR